MHNRIAFTGRKRTGKDTAANALVKVGYTKLAFAKPMTDFMAQILLCRGVPHSEIARMIDGDLKEVSSPALNGKTPRYFLQSLGTSWGRGEMSPTFWVDTLLDNVKHTFQFPKQELITISDLRMPNEAEALRAEGFIIVKIVRNGVSADKHATETGPDQILADLTILNSARSAKEFEEQVRYVIRTAGFV